MIAAFEDWLGQTVPGTTTAAKADAIQKQFFNQWVDFQAEGWGRYLARFAREIQANTGKQPVLSVQCGATPSLSRLVAADHRIWSKYINPGNLLLFCDQTTLWSDRAGNPSVVDIGQSTLLAAKDPAARIGANMIAEAPRFWSDVRRAVVTSGMPVSDTSAPGTCWDGAPVTSTDKVQNPLTIDECEWGRKEIKHGVLELSWTHIADEQGNVRRGLASIQRFDFDGGTWDPAIVALAQGIYPTRPFGYGFYYSTAIERAVEKDVGALHAGDLYDGYLDDYAFRQYKYGDQAAVNFLVSDVALAALAANPAAHPAAWIVPQANLLPAAERTALTAIAPILTTDADIIAFNASGHAPCSTRQTSRAWGFTTSTTG